LGERASERAGEKEREREIEGGKRERERAIERAREKEGDLRREVAPRLEAFPEVVESARFKSQEPDSKLRLEKSIARLKT
jgi:hypothetical protein